MAGATHMNSETPGTIDPRVFIKQLAPDQLGVFEPLSGVMLLNISDIGFVELGERWAANQSIESDIAIIRTINHETYHFAQAAASGYVFHRQCRSFMAFNTSKPMPQVPMDSGFAALAEQARISIGDDPELKARYERTIAMLDGHRQFALLNERAAEGDNSMMGALMPGFFRHLQVLAEQERNRGKTSGRSGCRAGSADEFREVGDGSVSGDIEPGTEIIPEGDAELGAGFGEAEEGIPAHPCSRVRYRCGCRR